MLKKLKNKWRKPKGLHNKLRLRKGGKGKVVKIGYGKKKKGIEIAIINNIKELINAKKDIIISSSVGLKKKVEILEKAKELKLNVLNVKNIDKFMEKIEKEREDKKKKSVDKVSKKEERLKKEDKKKKENLSKEEKEKKEKQEKKEVLERGL